MENLKGNGGVYETSPGKARAFAVFCSACGEMSVLQPLHTCDACEVGRHHDFSCPLCNNRWGELDSGLTSV